jgi:hypothetical protein
MEDLTSDYTELSDIDTSNEPTSQVILSRESWDSTWELLRVSVT